MSLWELQACCAGHNLANGAESVPEAPSIAEFEAAKAAHGL